jgi:DNA-binding NarL/FixJ family response regulator
MQVVALNRHAAAVEVLIALDDRLTRAGLRALLEREPGVGVVGEAAYAGDAVALAEELQPDVAVVDAGLPQALEATRRIARHSRVLVIGRGDGDDELFGALRAGASGFLVRESGPDELLRAVHCVAGGDALLSPRLTRRLIDELAAQPDVHRPVPERLEELTPREREVMGLVALGLTNQEIAARLVVSPATAKTHVSRAMTKLGARDRAQLVVFAYQAGLVSPRGPAR